MIKKLLLISCISFGLQGFSQNYTVSLTSGGTSINGQSINVTGDKNDFEIYQDLYVKNTSGSAKTLGVKRYETGVLSGTLNYFCWGQCYAPENAGAKLFWLAPDQLNTADAAEQLLSVHINPSGVEGTASFRFVVFDVNNTSDSVFFDVNFISQNSSSIEENKSKISLSLYPNPAREFLNIKIEGTTLANKTVEIFNIVGKKVYEINNVLNNNKVDVSSYLPGIYMVYIKESGKAIRTEKLIVSK